MKNLMESIFLGKELSMSTSRCFAIVLSRSVLFILTQKCMYYLTYSASHSWTFIYSYLLQWYIESILFSN